MRNNPGHGGLPASTQQHVEDGAGGVGRVELGRLDLGGRVAVRLVVARKLDVLPTDQVRVAPVLGYRVHRLDGVTEIVDRIFQGADLRDVSQAGDGLHGEVDT